MNIIVGVEFSGLLFDVFLPTLIAARAFSTNSAYLFDFPLSSLFYSVIGTIISTYLLSFLMFAVAGFSLYDSLMIGSVLSAINPESIFFDHGISNQMQTKDENGLFGMLLAEIILSGAVVFVTYKQIIAVLLVDDNSGLHYSPHFAGNATFHDKPGEFLLATQEIFGRFVGIAIGSACAGGLFAYTASKLIRSQYILGDVSKEFSLVVLFCALSYSLSRSIGISPVLTLFVTGITLFRVSVRKDLSASSRDSIIASFGTFAKLASTFVYVLLGIASATTKESSWGTFSMFSLIVALSTLVRTLVVIVTCGIINLVRIWKRSSGLIKIFKSKVVSQEINESSVDDQPQSIYSRISNFFNGTESIKLIPFKQQVVLVGVAIRGPVAYALALHIPEPIGSDPSLTGYCISIILLGQFLNSVTTAFFIKSRNVFPVDGEPIVESNHIPLRQQATTQREAVENFEIENAQQERL